MLVEFSTGVWVVGALAALAVILGWLARAGVYPRLAEPDPADYPTDADRRRYRWSGVACLSLGAAAALLLYAIPPERAPDALFRHAAYELGERWIGPLFVLLGVALATWPALLARLVRSGPRQHFLWDNAAIIGRCDPRPLSVWLGGLVALSALGVHYVVRSSHLTLTTEGVAWRDVFGTDQQRPWRDLRRVELVQHHVALVGNVVARPHLRLGFADGAVALAGANAAQPPQVWQRAAAIATERSGVAAVAVDR